MHMRNRRETIHSTLCRLLTVPGLQQISFSTCFGFARFPSLFLLSNPYQFCVGCFERVSLRKANYWKIPPSSFFTRRRDNNCQQGTYNNTVFFIWWLKDSIFFQTLPQKNTEKKQNHEFNFPLIFKARLKRPP